MRAAHIRQAAASIAVLALLVGTTPATLRTAPQCHCPPGCLMHLTGLRGACGHGSTTATPTTAVRIALAARDEMLPVFAPRRLGTAAVALPDTSAAEPPTDPPRAFPV